jgi:hypothetical protein
LPGETHAVEQQQAATISTATAVWFVSSAQEGLGMRLRHQPWRVCALQLQVQNTRLHGFEPDSIAPVCLCGAHQQQSVASFMGSPASAAVPIVQAEDAVAAIHEAIARQATPCCSKTPLLRWCTHDIHLL